MIYAGQKFKVWHVVAGEGRAACNAPLTNKKLIFTKTLHPGERLCSNCKGLMESAERKAK